MPNSPSAKRSSSMVEMIKGRWREFQREPSAFFFVVFMPLLWMAILGFAFSGGKQDTYGLGWPSTAVSDAAVQSIHAALASNPHIRLHEGDEAELKTALLRGDILLSVLPAAGGQAWTYSYDPGNRDAVRARSVVDDYVQAAAGRKDVLPTQDQTIAVPGTRYIDFLVPGLVAFSIMTSSLFGTGAVIVVARREGLLKRYLVTPMRPLEYVLSHIVGRFVILAVELVTILLGGWAMFGFRLVGNPVSFVVFAMLGAAVFTALALLCGSRTSNMGVMNGLTNLISLPMMIVAGVWFARSNFPTWLATPARFLPLTPLVDGLRRIALEGASLSSLGFELSVLVVYLIAGVVAAKTLFKWY